MTQSFPSLMKDSPFYSLPKKEVYSTKENLPCVQVCLQQEYEHLHKLYPKVYLLVQLSMVATLKLYNQPCHLL